MRAAVLREFGGPGTLADKQREEACSSFGLIGVKWPGSYAQLCVVPAVNAHPLRAGLPPGQAAALAANGPVARAQLDTGGVTAGSTVLVLGADDSLADAILEVPGGWGVDCVMDGARRRGRLPAVRRPGRGTAPYRRRGRARQVGAGTAQGQTTLAVA